MGFMGLFGGREKKAAEQERIIAQQKEQAHRNAVEEQRKAHEDLAWPGIPRLNAMKAGESRTAVEDSLTESRKDEVGQLAFEPDLTPEMLSDLTVQELLFLQMTITLFNSREPLANYEKNQRVLHNEFLGRIHRAEKFYVLMDRRTGYPFIDGGYAQVYFERERADQAAELYKAQFRDIAVIERDGEAAPEKEDGTKPLHLFDYLYYLGIENVMIDNGWYKGPVKRSEVSAPMDWNKDPKTSPPTNPKLVFAMIDYVSELRWPVKYDKRDEVVKKKTDRMMKLIPGGRYIIPSRVTDADALEAAGKEGKSTPRQVQLPAIKVNDKMYLPIFTDVLEYSKKFGKSEMKPVAFDYKNLVRFVTGGIEGIIINPNGQGIIIPRDKAQSLLFTPSDGKKNTKDGSRKA